MGESESDRADSARDGAPADITKGASSVPRTRFEAASSASASEEVVYRETFEHLPISMALLDGDGCIVDANWQWREFARVNGGDPEGYVGTNYLAVCRDSSDPQAMEAAALLEALLNGQRDVVEWEYPCDAPEEPRWFYLKAYRCLEGGERRFGVVHVEITPWRLAEEAEQQRAETDALTGMLNRRAFAERGERVLAIAERNAINMAIVFLDLDDYKAINDEYGHEMGDRVLAVVADRLQGPTRESDLQARFGGDEFVIIAEGADSARAERVAARLQELIATPITVNGHRFQLSCSQGIAIYPDDGGNLAALVNAADAAMYRAKKSGGARAVFAD
jgi:diguanylate cyclase (GGDEF)-like protein